MARKPRDNGSQPAPEDQSPEESQLDLFGAPASPAPKPPRSPRKPRAKEPAPPAETSAGDPIAESEPIPEPIAEAPDTEPAPTLEAEPEETAESPTDAAPQPEEPPAEEAPEETPSANTADETIEAAPTVEESPAATPPYESQVSRDPVASFRSEIPQPAEAAAPEPGSEPAPPVESEPDAVEPVPASDSLTDARTELPSPPDAEPGPSDEPPPAEPSASFAEAAETPPPQPAPPEKRRKTRSFLREAVETLILALLIFVVVRGAVQNFRVEGSSMNPSLADGDYLLVNKAIYFQINLDTLHKFIPFIKGGDNPVRYVFRAPRRGDVIVFRFEQAQNPSTSERDFIKRIIGEPGDTVEIRDGTVYINGSPLDEPYLDRKGNANYGPVTVPPKNYFVLGDNRVSSYDSRSWGMLPEDRIIGQAWLSYWPFSEFGLVNNKNLQPQAP